MSLERADSWVNKRPRSFSDYPSLKASLQSAYAASPGHATSITPAAKPVTGQTADITPALLPGRDRTNKQRPRSFVHQSYAALDFLNVDPVTTPSPSHSSQVTSRDRMSRRPLSCSAQPKTPHRPSKVQRWGGRTRTVSEWDGLRRVSEA